MFDVHTVHKMMTLFNNQSYIDDRDGIFLAWDAIQGDLPLSVYHEMSFSYKMKIKHILDLTSHIIKGHSQKQLI